MENFWGERVRVEPAATFAIRSSRSGSESFLRDIQQVIWAVNGNAPLTQVRTLRDLYEGQLARTSFTLVMLGIAAGMALLLALVGIYGVIAYAVSQRTREIGIRVALGARGGQVGQMFLRQGVLLATAGVICGLAGAAVLTRLMVSLLFGISPLEPITFILVALGFIVAAALASYVPALRAVTVDPVKALHSD
jgi:putative ABC transport system permease protein